MHYGIVYFIPQVQNADKVHSTAFLLFISIFYLLFTSTTCVRITYFKNCTEDTLFIGASHDNNIDSIDEQLAPCYDLCANDNLDTSGISLWKERIIMRNSLEYYIGAFKSCYIYPDSTCTINDYYLFDKNDTCYFFLIKWSDAKKYSWDEIRDKKMYRTWIVTKDKDGNYDTNIRYLE